MTNYEKYKEKIDKFLQDAYRMAIDKNEKELVDCRELDCKNCLFSSRYNENRFCEANRIKWLVAEYVEPAVDWNKVPIDTPVLVSDDGKDFWFNRYFAGINTSGKPLVYPDGRTSWSNKTFCCVVECFPYTKLAEVPDEESK